MLSQRLNQLNQNAIITALRSFNGARAVISEEFTLPEDFLALAPLFPEELDLPNVCVLPGWSPISGEENGLRRR